MSTNTPHSAAPPPDGRGLRVGVAVARFNAEVTERLLEGALRALKRVGVADAAVEVVRVPGAVELPLAAAALLRGGPGRPGAHCVVALGCVIRGETTHYDYVCRMAADGLLRVSLDVSLPVAFGVLTVDDEAQAAARSGPGEDNKGYEAALTAVECRRMIERLRGADDTARRP